MTTTAPPSTTDVPLDELAAGVRGPTTLPSDPGYDEARAVYNGAIDRRPAALVRCADVADVIACVNFAREHHMALPSVEEGTTEAVWVSGMTLS